ncbi:MAG TPA: restriction endonuclease [Candidatus Paceibacterota bacterium]|nr:restriction endonuclease [Candidatus Paceibacterota bacterium]
MKSSITFRNAYYIKLGRGGSWEEDSISKSLLRIGWSKYSLEDINSGRWSEIEKQLQIEHTGKPQVATTDFNRLRDIALSTPDDIWITFHGAKMWWGRLAAGGVESDQLSKFRRLEGKWSDKSLKGQLLVTSELPGKIAQLQGFRGTVCRVKETELLRRVLAGDRSPLALEISAHRDHLAIAAKNAIEQLHWKDYETLVDLVFRDTGWIRVSILGQQVKGYDLELREPITEDKYLVQVKSQASWKDLQESVSQFFPNDTAGDYKKIFFVTHKPADDLLDASDIPDYVDLIPPQQLANLVIDAGLSRWLEEKVA